MSTRRTIRVAEVIRKVLSEQIRRENSLEGILVTISAVDTSPDLREAFIYVSVLNPEQDENAVLAVLKNNRSKWQQEIRRQLPIKYIPHLHFRFDKGMERGDRIMQILRELEDKNKKDE